MHWRTYIKSASVVRYASLADASQKLTQLSGNQSPLLELFALASQNTAVDDPDVAQAFQPVQTVVPPGSTDQYILPPNQNYITALVTLQTSLEAIAGAGWNPQRRRGGSDPCERHAGQGDHAHDGAGLPPRFGRPHRCPACRNCWRIRSSTWRACCERSARRN